MEESRCKQRGKRIQPLRDRFLVPSEELIYKALSGDGCPHWTLQGEESRCHRERDSIVFLPHGWSPGASVSQQTTWDGSLQAILKGPVPTEIPDLRRQAGLVCQVSKAATY